MAGYSWDPFGIRSGFRASPQQQMVELGLERERMTNTLLRQEMEEGPKRQEMLRKMSMNYLNNWNKQLANSTGMFNKAAETISTAIADTKASIGVIDRTINNAVGEVNQSLSDYRQKYGGLETEAIDVAMEELGITRELGQQMAELSRPDVEGASARAKADVSAEGAAARQKMANDLIAMGIDPTSGTGQRMMRESLDTEAFGKVMAGNTARIAEKDRATRATATGLQYINPNETAGIATTIAAGDRQLLDQKNALTMAGINARTQLHGVQGSLANSMANVAGQNAQVAGQQGEFGAALFAEAIKPRV
jgi:hypothetical protein